LRSLNLFERERVRKIVSLGIRGIEVEPIPPCLEERERAILASNYLPLGLMIEAVLKAGCHLPGKEPRLRVIAREEIIEKANLLLKVMGVDKFVFPAKKDEIGVYRLVEGKRAYKEILNYLGEPGHILWLSITGETRDSGLSYEGVRTGAAVFSGRTQVPIVPMGIVTEERRGKRRVVKVRFGEPISPPERESLSDFARSDFLVDFSRLVMCRIAGLLPPGQRGDFENTEEKLREIHSRLRGYIGD